jgi:ubiquitin carboxyl-terminal hydrolase 14
MAFPEFNRTGANGAPLQQDAEEFFSGLLTIGAGILKEDSQLNAALPFATTKELGGATNLIDALFGLKMEETLTCDEFDDMGASSDKDDKMQDDEETKEAGASRTVEPPVKTFDLHRKLVCNIQGGSDCTAQTNVSHLAEGIALSLNGTIEKRSEVLGRDAVWTRKQRIARLPPILTVQFGRFYWKATPESHDHTGVKCKVMKPVTFNSTFDIYDFCSDQVKKELKKSRDKALKEEEDRINKKLKGENVENDVQMETGEDEETAALKAALAMSMQDEDSPPSPVGPGLPAEFQGQYELFAVVTHKGRDADGGHYMAWVKAKPNSGKVETIADTDEENEDWFVFDDDEVSPCKTEDVLKLKGGGDWHMSYLNFYRAKK